MLTQSTAETLLSAYYSCWTKIIVQNSERQQKIESDRVTQRLYIWSKSSIIISVLKLFPKWLYAFPDLLLVKGKLNAFFCLYCYIPMVLHCISNLFSLDNGMVILAIHKIACVDQMNARAQKCGCIHIYMPLLTA